MCICILNTKVGGRLPKNYIKNSWDNNNMGGGLLWNKEGKLLTYKTYDYKKYLTRYNQLRDDKKVDSIVLHFRIATSGKDGKENLHPFLVNDGLGFVHNGVISGLGNVKHSDTHQFNTILQGFKHDFLACQTTKSFINNYIGSSNKLLFLDKNGKHTIINEKAGHWDDLGANWFSNSSYESYNDYVWAGNKKVFKSADTSSVSKLYDTYSNSDIYDYNKSYYPSSANSESDYWDTFEELCLLYGLDPMDISSDKEIEYFMEINNVSDIYELYALAFDEEVEEIKHTTKNLF